MELIAHPGATTQHFRFDRVYAGGMDAPEREQREIYGEMVKPLVQSVVQGYNATVFAYGVTGSGKTYTMSGPTNSAAKGIIPRALDDLFAMISAVDGAGIVHLSYVELHKNKFRDLLASISSSPRDKKKAFVFTDRQPAAACTIELHENEMEGVYLTGSPSLRTPVRTTARAIELIELGNRARAWGQTNLNEHSSRSHVVLTLHVEIHAAAGTSPWKRKRIPLVKMGKLHLVDLAGSERISMSGASGGTLQETQSINKSLSTLGDVLSAVSKEQKRLARGGGGSSTSTIIPYRNSKLTTLLKDSLGGNARTLMITNLRSGRIFFHQTRTSLMYATRAKKIRLRSVVNKVSSAAPADLEERRKLEMRLRETENELAAAREEASTLAEEMRIAKETYANRNSGTLKSLDVLREKFQDERKRSADAKGILQRDLADMKQACAVKDAKLERIQTAVSSFTVNHDAMMSKLERAEEMIEEYKEKFEIERQKSRKEKEEFHSLAQKRMDENAAALDELRRAYEKKIAGMEASLKTEREHLIKANADAEAKWAASVDERCGDVAKLQSQLKDSGSRYEALVKDHANQIVAYEATLKCADEKINLRISRALDAAENTAIELKKSKAKNQSLQDMIEANGAKMTMLTASKDAALKEASESRERAREAGRNVDALMKKNDELAQKNEELSKEAADASTRAGALSAKYGELVQENEVLKTKNDELVQKNTELAQENDDLGRKAEKMGNSAKVLEVRVTSSQNAVKSLETTAHTLRSNLCEAESRLNAKSKRLSDLLDEISRLKHRDAAHESSIKALRCEREKYLHTIEQRKIEITSSKKTTESLRQEFESVSSECEAHRSAVGEMEIRIASQETEIHALRQQLAEACSDHERHLAAAKQAEMQNASHEIAIGTLREKLEDFSSQRKKENVAMEKAEMRNASHQAEIALLRKKLHSAHADGDNLTKRIAEAESEQADLKQAILALEKEVKTACDEAENARASAQSNADESAALKVRLRAAEARCAASEEESSDRASRLSMQLADKDEKLERVKARFRCQEELLRKHIKRANERVEELRKASLAVQSRHSDKATALLNEERATNTALRDELFELRHQAAEAESCHKCALEEADETWKRTLQYEMEESKASLSHIVDAHRREMDRIQREARLTEERLTDDLVREKEASAESARRAAKAEAKALQVASDAAACIRRYDAAGEEALKQSRESSAELFREFCAAAEENGIDRARSSLRRKAEMMTEIEKVRSASKDAEAEYLDKILKMQQSFRKNVQRLFAEKEKESALKEQAKKKCAILQERARRSASLAARLLADMFPIEQSLGIQRSQRENAISVSRKLEDTLCLCSKQLSVIGGALRAGCGPLKVAYQVAASAAAAVAAAKRGSNKALFDESSASKAPQRTIVVASKESYRVPEHRRRPHKTRRPTAALFKKSSRKPFDAPELKLARTSIKEYAYEGNARALRNMLTFGGKKRSCTLDLNTLASPDFFPFHVCVSGLERHNDVQKFEDVVRLLEGHGGDVSAKDEDGYTAFHRAVQLATLPSRAAMKAISAMADAGAELTAVTTSGDNALHIEAARPSGARRSILKLLLSLGVDVNAVGSEGKTPMSLVLFEWAKRADGIYRPLPRSPLASANNDALYRPPIETLVCLESSGGMWNHWNIRDSRGKTVLHLLLSMKVPEDLLDAWGRLVNSYLKFAVLDHGSNEADAVNAVDEDGNTPLHVFALRQRRRLSTGSAGDFCLNPTSLRVLRQILRRGAVLTIENKTGNTVIDELPFPLIGMLRRGSASKPKRPALAPSPAARSDFSLTTIRTPTEKLTKNAVAEVVTPSSGPGVRSRRSRKKTTTPARQILGRISVNSPARYAMR